MKRELESDSDNSCDKNVKKKLKANEEHHEFDTKTFRKNLKSGNFCDDLKFFINNIADSPHILYDFLESGGRPLEIVETIKRNEESTEILSNLFQFLLIVIANDDGYAQKVDADTQAIKYLVNKNKDSIVKMLSSAESVNKITILNILAIAVRLNREIGIEILKSIEIFAKANEKEDLSIFSDKKDKKKKKKVGSVRLAFVKFILSYLDNENDVILCKRMLQKRALFEFLVKDLCEDSLATIRHVLNNLTKSVLASNGFNKAEKLKIFSEDAVKSLLKLYEWKINESSKEEVVNITHHFLLLLLTSKKHGIVFKAFAERHRNLRQGEVLGYFKTVWMQEYPSKLIIEIIKACPDLMQIMLDRLVMGLQPKKTAHWFMCANFVKELFSALEPALMINFLSTLPAKKISSNIIKLSISHYILQNVNENALIQQESLEICEVSTGLLHLMLSNCCKYLDEINKIASLKDFERHRIKFDIINHIFTFFPHIDIILNSLYRSINLSVRKKTDDSERLVKSQLKNTLNILILIIDRFPSIIEKIPSVIDYLDALRPIYEFQLNTSGVDHNEDLEIEMKVVKIILSLQPDIISTETDTFNRVFLVMTQVYCCSTNEVYRKEAKLLLFGMLQNTGIFSSSDSLEISIWLEALRQLNRGLLKESATAFIDVLKKSKNSEYIYSDKNKDDGEVMLWNPNILKLIDSCDTNNANSNVKFNRLSAALQTLLKIKSSKLNRIIDFVEISCLLLYHSYPDQKKSFKSLISQQKDVLNTRLIEYFDTNELTDFGDMILPTYSEIIYHRLQKSILAGEKIDAQPKCGEECLFLILQTVFCSVKLSQQDLLTDNQVGTMIAYIRELNEKIQNIDNDKMNEQSASNEEQEHTKVVNKIFAIEIQPLSDMLLSHIFEHNGGLFNGFDINSNSSQMTNFVIKLIEIFNSNRHFDVAILKYRLRIISQLRESTSTIESDNILNSIDMLPFSGIEFIQLLEAVCAKKASSTQIRLIMLILRKLTKLQSVLLSPEHVRSIENIYSVAAKNQKCDFINEFEDVLESHFSAFPHNIQNMTTKIFELSLLDDLTATRSFVKLICTLFASTDKWNEFFIGNASKLRKEILFPMLHIAFHKGIIKESLLNTIYQDFKSGIIRAIEKPKRAAQIYRENIKSSIVLIQNAMPANECRDLSMKKFKFESTDIFQMEMLSAVYLKAAEKDVTQKDTIFLNFINNWLQMFKLIDAKMCPQFVSVLSTWLKGHSPSENVDFDRINASNFENLYQKCLKHGLKSSDSSNMLIVLGKFISILNIEDDQTAKIFDMILTHSNFFNLVFSVKHSMNKWKRDLFFLINVLIQKNPRIAHKKHVPIYLSSYQATMSSCDQLILNLLRFYELQCEIDLYEFRPFLFGHNALAHFTSIEDGELKIASKSIDNVNSVFFKLINSFEKSIIENTVRNYPIKRKLAGINLQELSQLITDDDSVECCNMYDPAYFLPLFDMFLSTDTFNFVSFAIKKKLMSLVPPGLSCENENIRLIAAHILMKCRANTEGKKTTKEIWVRLYDLIQKGLADVREGTTDDKKKKSFPRISSISSQLLAEFFNIVPDNLHKVHSIAANYLLIREKFEFATIPEFAVLLCSFDVQQDEHRLFLLNTISNGIKDSLDFKILNNTPLIKMILSCFGCSISNRKIDLLILKIIDNLVTKTDQSKFLLERYGLGLWIFQAAANVEAFEYDLIDGIIALIKNLVDKVKSDAETSKMLMSSLLLLLQKFTKTRLSLESFVKFISTVNVLQQSNALSVNISSKNYELTLELANIFIPIELKQYLQYINQFPMVINDTNSSQCFEIADEPTKELINQCRKFIKKFHSNRNLAAH